MQVTVRIPRIELQRSLTSSTFSPSALQQYDSEAEQELATYLITHLHLLSGDQPCQPVSPDVHIIFSNDLSRITRSWMLVCPSPWQLRLRNDAFFATAPAHLHFARVRINNGSVIEKLFAVHQREWSLSRSENTTKDTGSHFYDYLRLGVTHILSGADHLVFLLALLLMAESLASVAQVVTGFTVAHSVTLALGVLNVVRPASSAIESLIGFSIMIVALENFWITTGDGNHRWLLQFLIISLVMSLVAAEVGFMHIPLLALLGVSIFSVAYLLLQHRSAPRQHLRWVTAFIFGFIHGFGFAGVLTEIALPTNRLAAALLSFNLGVELGQLGIVALVWPFLMRLNRLREEKARLLTIHVGSAAILAVGIFWFVTRAVG